ncbi:MAG: DNA repair protein RadA [Acidimicrobiia bacterium]|nr:DNA repair protein RadA [Acidimicrobiia bacterium]
MERKQRSSRRSASRTVHRCQECGHESRRWLGQCPGCEAWGTLAEEVEAADIPDAGDDGFDELVRFAVEAAVPPVPLAEVSAEPATHRPTGIAELDRVLGGGLVGGGAILLGGEPGIGKSTLLLQLAAGVASSGSVLYVSAEESGEQVRLRADRLDAVHPRVLVSGDDTLPAIVGRVQEIGPVLLVVDSIQTIRDPRLGSAAGSVGQVRECAATLVRLAKQTGATLVLAGHVTKEGQIAGPRVLEHLVDVVLELEGDRHRQLRVLRSVKNRFGAAGELGLFELDRSGLVPARPHSLTDPDDHRVGSAVVCAMAGDRPLLAGVQALTVPAYGSPRRAVTGIDLSRALVLVAVADRRGQVPCAGGEVYLSVTGGLKVTDPACDLGICVALASTVRDVRVPPRTVWLGEVGLGGELRAVTSIERRLKEAARFGFRRAVVPEANMPIEELPDGEFAVLPESHLADVTGSYCA